MEPKILFKINELRKRQLCSTALQLIDVTRFFRDSRL